MQEQKSFTDYKVQLRQRILNAAMEAFGGNGVKSTKMDDIAATLGISKRTLYEIFENKEKLLFECISNYDAQRRQQLTTFMGHPGHDVVDIIVYLYRNSIREAGKVKPTFYVELVKYPQVTEYLMAQRQRQHDEFMDFIRRGVSEGYFRSDLDYDLIAQVLNNQGRYMHSEQLWERYTFEEPVFNMLFVTIRGICTAKGIEKLDRLTANAE